MASEEPLEPKQPITPGKMGTVFGVGAAAGGLSAAVAAFAGASNPWVLAAGLIAGGMGLGGAYLGLVDVTGGSPRQELPEGGVPEGGVPEGGVPEGGVPEGGVPEGGVPEGDEGGCFVAGTAIALIDGITKPIDEIQMGDYILSRHEVSGEILKQKILKTWVHKVNEILLLKLTNGEEIKTTKAHRFSVEERGFVAAGSLQVGDYLHTHTGEVVQIASAAPICQDSTVYNLEVDQFHTYFVSETGVWVHNVKINQPVEEEPVIELD
jgi:Pretoxin HINT domain